MINQKTDFLGNAYDKNGFLLKNCVVEHYFFCYVFAYLGLKSTFLQRRRKGSRSAVLLKFF